MKQKYTSKSKSILGGLIRQARLNNLRININEFAKLAGVSPEYITQIELGKKSPDLEVFAKIVMCLKPEYEQALMLKYHYLQTKFPKWYYFDIWFHNSFEAVNPEDFIVTDKQFDEYMSRKIEEHRKKKVDKRS